jgi:hypothetical protein
MDNLPEFGKIAEEYSEKAGKNFGPNGLSGTEHYNDKYLWKSLANNARSIQHHPGIYPAIERSYDGENDHFSHSPQFSDQFNKARGDLRTLYEAVLPQGTGCLSLKKNFDTDETYTEFTKRRVPSTSLEELNSTEITPDNLQTCSKIHCSKCKQCADHHAEFKKALEGIYSTDPDTGDSMRPLHIKNLISVMHNWAAHQDGRGYDEDTMGDRDYRQDAYGHNLFATTLRSTADKFKTALEADYINSEGKGGLIHKEYLGDVNGKNKETYQ